MKSQINCPDCGSPIMVNTQLLIAGNSFSCSHCPVSISLAAPSVSVVDHAMSEFNKLADLKKSVGQSAQAALHSN